MLKSECFVGQRVHFTCNGRGRGGHYKEIEERRAARLTTAGQVPFQSGGGKFYTPKMMANLRYAEMLNNAKKKRGEPYPSYGLFYGNAW